MARNVKQFLIRETWLEISASREGGGGVEEDGKKLYNRNRQKRICVPKNCKENELELQKTYVFAED